MPNICRQGVCRAEMPSTRLNLPHGERGTSATKKTPLTAKAHLARMPPNIDHRIFPGSRLAGKNNLAVASGEPRDWARPSAGRDEQYQDMLAAALRPHNRAEQQVAFDLKWRLYARKFLARREGLTSFWSTHSYAHFLTDRLAPHSTTYILAYGDCTCQEYELPSKVLRSSFLGTPERVYCADRRGTMLAIAGQDRHGPRRAVEGYDKPNPRIQVFEDGVQEARYCFPTDYPSTQLFLGADFVIEQRDCSGVYLHHFAAGDRPARTVEIGGPSSFNPPRGTLVYACAFDDDTLAIARSPIGMNVYSSNLTFHQAQTGELLHFLPTESLVKTLTLSSGYIFAGHCDGSMSVWHVTSGQRRLSIETDLGPIISLATSGSYIAVAGKTGRVAFYEMIEGDAHLQAELDVSAKIVGLVTHGTTVAIASLSKYQGSRKDQGKVTVASMQDGRSALVLSLGDVEVKAICIESNCIYASSVGKRPLRTGLGASLWGLVSRHFVEMHPGRVDKWVLR